MTWLRGAAATGDAPFDAALGLRPDLRDLYRKFYGALWDDNLVPAELLELCRLRIAQLHDCESELVVRHADAGVSDEQIAALSQWQGSDLFSEPERAALALAEKMPWQHHDLTDDEYALLQGHLGEAGVVALTIAVALFDTNCRLRLTFGTEAAPVEAQAPASGTGPIY